MNTSEKVASGRFADGGSWVLSDETSTIVDGVAEKLEWTGTFGSSVSGGTGPRLQPQELARASFNARSDDALLVVRCREDVVSVTADRGEGGLERQATSEISGVSGDRFVVFTTARQHGIRQLVAACGDGETATLVPPPSPPRRPLPMP